MYWYVNKSVPTLTTHAQAMKHFESITPLKSGPLKGRRPIGARKKVSQRIWLTPDGDVKVQDGWTKYVNVEVTYYQTGDITVAWPSGHMHAGVMGFVSKLLGIEINYRGSRPWVHNVVALRRMPGTHRWQHKYEKIRGSFPLLKGGMIRLTRTVPYGAEQGTISENLMLGEPIFPVVRSTDRDGAKAIRAEHREFALFLKGTLGLFNTGFSPSDYEENEVSTLTRADMITLIRSSDPSENLKAVMWLAQANRATSRYSWRGDSTSAADLWTATKVAIWADYDKTILDADPNRAYNWTKRYDGKVYKENVRLMLGERE